MSKTIGKNGGGSGAATTKVPGPGGIPAEPKTEPPAGAQERRHVLGFPVEVLPSRYDYDAKKPLLFRTAEDYADLEAKPLRNILSRLFESAKVKFAAIAAVVGTPLLQIAWDEKIDIGLLNYLVKHKDNILSFLENRWEHASNFSMGFAVAAAAAILAVGLSIPFISNKPREEAIARDENHEDGKLRKAAVSNRVRDDAHRVVRKLRGASFAAFVPLFAFDIASKSFNTTLEFIAAASTSTRVALAAFITLTVASIGTALSSESAKTRFTNEEVRVLRAKEKREQEERDAADGKSGPAAPQGPSTHYPKTGRARSNPPEAWAPATGSFEGMSRELAALMAVVKSEKIPTNDLNNPILRRIEELHAVLSALKAEEEKKVVPIRASCSVVPKTEKEAEALEDLYNDLEQRDIEISNFNANMQVLQEKLGDARQAEAAYRKKIDALEKASGPSKEAKTLKDLKDGLDAKQAEIGEMQKDIATLTRKAEDATGERDTLKHEKERAERERDEYARKHDEKDNLLRDATARLEALEKEAQRLRAEAIAAKSARPKTVHEPAVAPAAPVAAEEAPAQAAAPEPIAEPAAPAESAAAPEPLRGSPSEGGLPETVSDSKGPADSGDPDDYDPNGSAVSV